MRKIEKNILEVKEDVRIGDIILEAGDKVQVLEAQYEGAVYSSKENRVLDIVANMISKNTTLVRPDFIKIVSWNENAPTPSGGILGDFYSVTQSWEFEMEALNATKTEVQATVKGTFVISTSIKNNKSAYTAYSIGSSIYDITTNRSTSAQESGAY